MADKSIDLSILCPFSPPQIDAYLAFLRKNGAVSTAVAVEAALKSADVTGMRDASSGVAGNRDHMATSPTA